MFMIREQTISSFKTSKIDIDIDHTNLKVDNHIYSLVVNTVPSSVIIKQMVHKILQLGIIFPLMLTSVTSKNA